MLHKIGSYSMKDIRLLHWVVTYLVLPYRVVLSKTLRVSVEGIFENSLDDLGKCLLE